MPTVMMTTTGSTSDNKVDIMRTPNFRGYVKDMNN